MFGKRNGDAAQNVCMEGKGKETEIYKSTEQHLINYLDFEENIKLSLNFPLG